MLEYIVLVDENDRAIGFEEKLATHEKALLHRAFSVFITNGDGAFLIQRRAKEKYHSGGLLTNSCCSHPRRDETMEEALSRCIFDELGIKPDLSHIKFCGKFTYLAPFDTLSEHEIDNVFLLAVGDDIIASLKPNPAEIEELFWWSEEEICRRLAESPEDFTAWFKPAFELALN